MKYFINKDNEIFAFDLDGSQDDIIPKELVEISNEELVEIKKSKEEEYKNSLEFKLKDAQSYLDRTQHKFGADYEPKEGEDLVEVKTKRSIARAFLRENKPSNA